MSSTEKNNMVNRAFKVKYKSEYDTRVIEMFRIGKSLADFCVSVPCGRRVVYDWIDKHPTFAVAYEVAREAAKSFRDNTVQKNLSQSNDKDSMKFDVNSYMRLTQSRFKDMEKESPNINLFNNLDDPDLFKAMIKLAHHTSNEAIPGETARQLAAIISTTIAVKEKELMEERLEKVEEMLELGVLDKNLPVLSPEPEYTTVEDDTEAK